MDHTKREAQEEEQAFLPDARSAREEFLHAPTEKQSYGGKAWRWMRLLLEICMAAAIVVLLKRSTSFRRDTMRRTPVPQLPRKIYTFAEDHKYLNDEMWFNETDALTTLHNWIELSSASRGYIVIDDASKYDLPEPYQIQIDRFKDGPGYMMTVYHQLHCLSYLAVHYQQGYGGVELTKEVAHHTAHCFNYLRQGLMCSADTTLEGKTDEGPGEGSEHECVDYDALLEWANEHAAFKVRGLLPDTATL